jgi:hypothetical protein
MRLMNPFVSPVELATWSRVKCLDCRVDRSRRPMAARSAGVETGSGRMRHLS